MGIVSMAPIEEVRCELVWRVRAAAVAGAIDCTHAGGRFIGDVTPFAETADVPATDLAPPKTRREAPWSAVPGRPERTGGDEGWVMSCRTTWEGVAAAYHRSPSGHRSRGAGLAVLTGKVAQAILPALRGWIVWRRWRHGEQFAAEASQAVRWQLARKPSGTVYCRKRRMNSSASSVITLVLPSWPDRTNVSSGTSKDILRVHQ